ncbi:peptidylprolyl isomerase [Frateuria aurantia]
MSLFGYRPHLPRFSAWAGLLISLASSSAAIAASPLDRGSILAQARPEEWQTLAPDRLMYLQLSGGQVVIELAPQISPLHVANLETLIRQHYFDGLAVVRLQDNFVAQWDDPATDDGGDPRQARSLGAARRTLPPEFSRSIAADDRWTPLPDGDLYASQVGFLDGFPAARDPASGLEWLVHCYGMVGAGRDIAPDSGNASSLYAVIGQAPRQLDHNLAVVGRVISGVELLSSLPRGKGHMGFYERPDQRTPILSVRLGSDLPAGDVGQWQQLRTDSPSFARLLDYQRSHRSAFYPRPLGRLELCRVDLPVRHLQLSVGATPAGTPH